MSLKYEDIGNVPRLRFPEFEGKWERKKISALCNFIVPGRNKPKVFDGEIPWITTPDIPNSGILERSKKNLAISFEEAKRIGAKIVPTSSIIISCVGELGVTAIAKNELIINQQLHAFITKGKLNNLFLYYILGTRRRYMERVATKTAVPYMNSENCNSIPISFPSLPEQQKIATFLTAIDERIRLLEQKKSGMEVYKKGVMQKLFSQELRFKDDAGNDFPDWEEKRLGEVCDINKGKQLNKVELTEAGQYPCQNGGIDPSGYTNEYNTLENTITISEGGNSCGYVNLLKTKFWCGGHCYALVNLTRSVLLEFLYQQLKYQQNDIMKLRVGSGLPNIQKGDISKFKLYLPFEAEQQKIASFLTSLDKSIESITKEIDGTVGFKKGLLQKMFV
jgi:type I restriction enzyme S subunit